MEIKLTGKKIFFIITGIFLWSLVLWFGTRGDGLATILEFIDELSTFTIQAILVVSVALLMVYTTNLVRSMEWYDKHGAGTELAKVRDRVGTGDEKPGDPMACGLQYMASSILIAVMILSFFLIHG